MISYSLKYDNIDYTEYLCEDEDFILTSNVEDGLNNPVCSTLEFTLNNRNNIHNAFGNGVNPYGIFSSGHIVLYADFPQYVLFDGYIDRESIEVDFDAQKIRMKAIGKEKQISDYASKIDLTQVFQERDNDISVRSRWGRGSASRHDPTNYSQIENLIADIFEDLGYDSSKHFIYIPYSEKYYFTYNANRWGAVFVNRPMAIVRNNTGNRILPELSSGNFRSFFENDADSGSYNLLLKEFAKITNCIYFYYPKLDKVFFIPRDYELLDEKLLTSKVDIDNRILSDDYIGMVEQPYSGVALKFEDIDLVVYRDQSSIIPGGTIKYGVNIPEGTTPVIVDESPNGYFLGFNDSDVRYKLGSSLANFNEALYLDNAVEVNMKAELWEYIRPDAGILGESDAIDEYLTDIIFENFYSYTLRTVRKRRTTINMLLPAPNRVIYQGNELNYFYSECDLWNEITTLEFRY